MQRTLVITRDGKVLNEHASAVAIKNEQDKAKRAIGAWYHVINALTTHAQEIMGKDVQA